MASPVDEHLVAGTAEQGQSGVESQGGAAGKKQAVVHAEPLRPQLLGRVKGLAAGKEVAGGLHLGHVQRSNGLKLRDGQEAALVAGHVKPGRFLCGVGADGVIEWGHGLPPVDRSVLTGGINFVLAVVLDIKQVVDQLLLLLLQRVGELSVGS